MQVIAFIPARGGSKGIKDKNIIPIAGKPLIYWVSNALENAKIIDKTIIATDSEKIKKTILDFNFSKVKVFDRNKKNAQDTSPTIDVVLEYLNTQDYNDSDLFCLVQATSPLINSQDIDSCITKLLNNDYDSAFGCVELKRICWTKDGLPINHDLKARKRRNEIEGILIENGAIYVNKIGNIKKEKQLLTGKIMPFIMKDETYTEIDEPEDIVVVEELLKKQLSNQ